MKKAKEIAGRKCPICGRTEKQVNAGKYLVMIMVSRLPRQIAGFYAAFDKTLERIQKIVNNDPDAKYYCTDGYLGYVDIVYPIAPPIKACQKINYYFRKKP